MPVTVSFTVCKETKEWSIDTFIKYEEEVDDDGMVEIPTTFPEGEIMRVYVDKKPIPKFKVEATGEAGSTSCDKAEVKKLTLH
ncbi:hypothetical protein FRB94_006938 [Tulasnella sp. JGI-2019a]|nr:hypothetical protein FRB93_001390 [Tulasnella sp. JGI-2019a]KAG8998282.1 hypothetical protein FRB94_006938 [Tulasnella sp. JGI-2019a]KAG9031264.1 hypothetical protein FRB95_002904 [Tulasnella sp. JGI-2019a]